MLSQLFSAVSSPFKFLSGRSGEEGEILNVKIITRDYGITKVSLPQNDTVANAKKIIFYFMTDQIADFQFKTDVIEEVLGSIKLIRMKTSAELKDSTQLSIYNLENDEEILLTFRRSPDKSQTVIKNNLASPTDDQIVAKTSHLPNPNSTPIYRINYLFLQDDLRKVFITLATESAYILSTHSHSLKILKYYRAKINNYMNSRENACKVMYKLGFSQDNVKHAMRLNANNYKLALDWLIDNVKQHENLRLSKSPRSSLISNKRTSILSASFDITTSTSLQERLDGLLGIVEFYSEMDEPVYDMNLSKMVYMGFEAEEAREALRIVKNNVAAACEYLAGRTNGSIMELRVGLDQSSPIYNLLMKLPALQELLSYSESFVYINKILEDHIIEWDPELSNGQLMRNIISTYHDEKHYLVANQFNKSTIPISALSAPLAE